MVAEPMDAGWREDRGEAIQELESREAQGGPTGGIGFRQEVENPVGTATGPGGSPYQLGTVGKLKSRLRVPVFDV